MTDNKWEYAGRNITDDLDTVKRDFTDVISFFVRCIINYTAPSELHTTLVSLNKCTNRINDMLELANKITDQSSYRVHIMHILNIVDSVKETLNTVTITFVKQAPFYATTRDDEIEFLRQMKMVLTRLDCIHSHKVE